MNRRTSRDQQDREHWYDDTAPYTGLAVAFFILGLLFVYAFVNNSSMLYWTETAVRGSQQNGIVYYSFHGAPFSINNPNETSSHPATVWVDPAHPYNATLQDPLTSKLIDVLTVGGPFTVAVVLLPVGLLRRRRRRRRRRLRAADPDQVQADDAFRRLLEQRRRESPGPGLG